MRCPLAKNTVLRAKEYRMLVVHNYVVFYVLSGNMYKYGEYYMAEGNTNFCYKY